MKFKTIPKYECPDCSKKFYNPQVLETHRRFKHINFKTSETIEDDDDDLFD